MHLGTLVAAVIVHDQVHVLVSGNVLFQTIQELDEFAAAVQFLAGPNTRRAIPFIIVRLPLRQSHPALGKRRAPGHRRRQERGLQGDPAPQHIQRHLGGELADPGAVADELAV